MELKDLLAGGIKEIEGLRWSLEYIARTGDKETYKTLTGDNAMAMVVCAREALNND